MRESKVPAAEELPFKRSTTDSFPVDVKTIFRCESNEFEAVILSPKRSEKKLHIYLMAKVSIN